MAGYAIMWMDGPLVTYCSRLKHVGLSIEHNEYMAITAAAKKLVWITQLFEEIFLTGNLLITYCKPISR